MSEEPLSRTRTHTGKALNDLTMDAVLDGSVGEQDFRIGASTLLRQAQAAESAGYPQLAQNLRRAAELTNISNQEVLDIYNTLRPGRTSYAELCALAERLEQELAAPLTASLVREAAEAYLARGLVDKG
jgi:propanediol dehydratase small subunit